jgi:F0F1-type ATP synthase membrane subunit a
MIRKLIRPITLGVRLAVNLLTGHLLVSMFSNFHISFILNLNNFFFFFFFFFGLFIFFYEMCVCVIQAIVYTLMVNQYAEYRD